jgi:16S rRNA (cytosine967-C5)-methyltransferase
MNSDPLTSEITPVLVDRPPLFEQEGVRGVAVRSLLRIESTTSDSEHIVCAELHTHPEWNEFDRALFQELVYGTLRWRAKLDWILTGFYHGEFAKCLPVVQQALRVALYQILMISKIPPQQAIESAAHIIERTRSSAYAATLTGVLRSIARNIAGIRYPPTDQRAFHLSVVQSHPLWLVERWLQRYGEELAEQMLAANLERPPLYLAANRARSSVTTLSEWLGQNAIPFEAVPNNPSIVRINPFADYTRFEPWQQGLCFISDPVYVRAAERWAQHATGPALYVSTRPSRALLPVIEQAARLAIPLEIWTGLPVVPSWITHECDRLGWQQPRVVPADIDQPFSSIIIEADSSGIGLWRRKPERKWRADSSDVRRSTQRLSAQLQRAIPHLEPSGTLLLIVPSTEPEETESVAAWLEATYPDIERIPPSDYHQDAVLQPTPDGALQSLPHLHRGDSVYVALFQRTR